MLIEVTLAETCDDEDQGIRLTASVETEVALPPELVRDYLCAAGDEALRAFTVARQRAEQT